MHHNFAPDGPIWVVVHRNAVTDEPTWAVHCRFHHVYGVHEWC